MKPDSSTPAALSTGAEPRVSIYSRQGCCLCEEALAVALRVCAQLGAHCQLVDIDAYPQLREQYSDHVPVTFVDGVLLSRWVLDEQVLLAALQTHN